MNQNNGHDPDQYQQRTYSISRKRQIIDRMMNDLHSQMLDFIDAAVDSSDLAESKTVIAHIMQK